MTCSPSATLAKKFRKRDQTLQKLQLVHGHLPQRHPDCRRQHMGSETRLDDSSTKTVCILILIILNFELLVSLKLLKASKIYFVSDISRFMSAAAS